MSLRHLTKDIPPSNNKLSNVKSYIVRLDNWQD